MLASTPILLAALLIAAPPADRRHPLPSDDPCVYDVQTEFGAKGDGVADDTAALQAALNAACANDSERSGIVYLPAGTYRLTGTLVANVGRPGSGAGPWFWGESRDSVILKLDDGAGLGPDGIEGTDDDLTSVIRTHPADSGRTSANWFMRNLRRFTVDAGDNPNVDGIRYFASNLGVIRDVTVKGNGPVGINSNHISEAGPDLIHNVTVDGFNIGVKSQWRYGQTLTDVTILNAKEAGVTVAANAVGIEDLKVVKSDRALINEFPNNWHWWGGAVAMIGGEFRTNHAP
ncbi:MAG: glycosyl hydrolase family 28-related protein, partial [Planctomycetota bacterium]